MSVNKTKGIIVTSKRQKKTSVGKTLGIFKCTSEICSKSWTSVHAWTSGRTLCELCNSKAKVINFVDEMCELDYYNCSGCGISWQCIHGDISEKNCHDCGEAVCKEEGTQSRFGRHFWYKCLKSKECGVEWEDFQFGKSYSQRCTKCHSSGVLISTRVANPNEMAARSRNRFGTGGGHNVEGCDMCQELQASGIAQSCRRKKLVIILESEKHDGTIESSILEAR